eukprot:5581826-Alexandrium_andersonii.AAC.1
MEADADGWAAPGPVSRRLAAAGFTPAMIRECVEHWAGLEVVEAREDGCLRICPDSLTPPPLLLAAPAAPPATPVDAPGFLGGRAPLALLSLFDGIGTARLGVEDALAALPQQGRLVASWFVESDEQLAPLVETYWRGRARLLGLTPHRRAAAGVWELLHGGGAELRRVEATLPRGTHLLVVAGSPCQDLTTASSD